MLQELDYDLERDFTFFDVRLREESRSGYLDLLREVLQHGTPESFSEAVLSAQMLKETETRDLGDRRVVARISSIAHYNIGEAEFNRYYMRAICLRAHQEGIEEVEVYRAKPVVKPRPAEGERKNAKELLEHLRSTNISVAGSFPGPNSGRSIRFPKDRAAK